MKLKRKLLIVILINILLLQNLISSQQKLKRVNLASKSDVTSKKNELNELSKQIKAISDLIKDLMNKFSILNRTKHFSLGIFQNYLVVIH